jgi:hypothetical protein
MSVLELYRNAWLTPISCGVSLSFLSINTTINANSCVCLQKHTHLTASCALVLQFHWKFLSLISMAALRSFLLYFSAAATILTTSHVALLLDYLYLQCPKIKHIVSEGHYFAYISMIALSKEVQYLSAWDSLKKANIQNH